MILANLESRKCPHCGQTLIVNNDAEPYDMGYYNEWYECPNLNCSGTLPEKQP